MNKKAELNPIAIIVLIIFIGLAIFLIVRYVSTNNQKSELNVTPINDSVTSTATQYVNPRTGGINVTGGTDLTIKTNISAYNQTNLTAENKTIVKVIYPNRTLTPGDILSNNVTEICQTGYSASVRDVSDSDRASIYLEYKLSPNQPTGTFEIDHLIPLELGGSNNYKNLWPQPRDPRPGYKEKDVLENYYHKQVCAGKMELRTAQGIMATNWFQGYLDAKESGGIK